MTDRLFTAALTFILLVAGTCAIGAALFGLDRPAASGQHIATVQLPRVEITARREVVLAAPDATDVAVVTLPRVEIIGRRTAADAGFVEAVETTEATEVAPAERPAIAAAAATRAARVHPASVREGEICIE